MSAAIAQAIDTLADAIDRMEGAVVKAKKVARPPQTDLFSMAAKPANVNQTGAAFDRNALARKLDVTIARVEQLLREA